MAVDPVANLYVQLGMDVARLQGDVQKATTILDNFQRRVDRGFSTMLKGIGWTAAFAGVTGFLHKAVQEASAAEQAITQLNTSLATLGAKRVGDINLVSAAIQRMAKEMQAATGFTDEEIMRGASRMLTAGIGTEDLKLATETATNLARAYGLELEPAMQMVVQAYWGQQRAIKKVVPEMQELLQEGMRGTDVLKQLNDALGPQAQAQAETFAGQLRLLRIESAEFAEAVGMKVLPMLTKFLSLLNAIRKGEGLKGYEMFNALGDVFVSPEQAAASIAGMTPSQLEKMTGGATWNHPLMYGKPGVKPKVEGKETKRAEDRYVDTEEAYLRLIKEEAKFYDGIAAGLKAVADQKNFIIDADQKMLDIERLVSLSEEDYLAATLANHERRVQVQRDLIAERLKWNNVIDAREMEELERAERLLEVQKERVRVEETLRKDPFAGAYKALSDLQKEYQSYGKLMEDYTVGVFRTMEMAFADFCDTGQFKFKEFVRSALINLNTLLFKIAVLEPMAAKLRDILSGAGGGGVSFGGFGSILGKIFGGINIGGVEFTPSGMMIETLTSAKGNAFMNGRLLAYARGGIVQAPTVFPMASGMGLMGEAGPEAVIPLKRTASGDLGVQAGAGGATYNITIQAADAQSFYEMCRRNPSAITDPIERALQGNQSIRRTIMRTAK
ncbi:MAG TPA: phage tail tape measure protein [Anaerolineae bacterium]|nr:phage tail tape measure protein [Anaerolineae bacterium]